jgi:methanogenic corrinoid protein MtbC1
MKPPLFLRRLALIIVIGVSLASVARADEPPKFASPEVNDYVKRQTAWMDEYIAAVQAGDEDKRREVNKKRLDDMDKNVSAIREKLTDAEQPVFTKWRNGETERMEKALKEKYPQ